MTPREKALQMSLAERYWMFRNAGLGKLSSFMCVVFRVGLSKNG